MLSRLEQRDLIREISNRVRDEVLATTLPEHWDGRQIRQYLAEKFSREKFEMSKVDLKLYRNDVITLNL